MRVLKRKLVLIPSMVVAAILVPLIAIHFFDNPRPVRDVITIECRWYDPALHTFGHPVATSDAGAIRRITHEITKGRRFHQIGKVRVIATIKLLDNAGTQQEWVLFGDNTLGEMGTSKDYSFGPELQNLLREALPPPTNGGGSTTNH